MLRTTVRFIFWTVIALGLAVGAEALGRVIMSLY